MWMRRGTWVLALTTSACVAATFGACDNNSGATDGGSDVSTDSPGAGDAADGGTVDALLSDAADATAYSYSVLDDTSKWTPFDTALLSDAGGGGFWGTAFDGRYVYFVPLENGPNMLSNVTRYDTQANFASMTSWSTFDRTAVNAGAKGFAGAALDGRYL